MITEEHLRRLTAVERKLVEYNCNPCPTVPQYDLGAPVAGGPFVVGVIAGLGGGSRVAYILSDLTVHIASDPTYASNFGYSVAFGPVWVVACDNNFLHSADGINWNSVASPFSGGTAFDILWVGALSKFVAGGSNSSGQPLIATSPDGITWTLRSTPWDADGGFVNGLAFANIAGTPIRALGSSQASSGTSYVMMKSSDGISWTNVDTTPAVGNQLYRAAYLYRPGKWVAVGPAGDGNGIYESSDGNTWSPVRTGGIWLDVCEAYTPTIGAAVSTSTTVPVVISDEFSGSWVNASSPITGSIAGGITYSNTLSLFIRTGGNHLYTSPDGNIWTDFGNIGFYGARLLAF